MYKHKEEKGITLIILVSTVMVLLIIAGVGIGSGLNIMKKASIESLKTNMLLLQAKGKEYVENANFKIGTGEKAEEEIAQIKNENLKGTPVSTDQIPSEVNLGEGEEAYQLSEQDMKDMGLVELEGKSSDYLIVYNIQEEKVNVIYVPGIEFQNKYYYTLSSIEDEGI